jgi:DNA invertase Pin-like site-specific DNA recombinase
METPPAPSSATQALIDRATAPRARRRRSEARRRLERLAVAYLRVSTKGQADLGHGLDAQRTQLLAFAEREGLNIVDWFEDRGISGSTLGRRPELLVALGLLASGKAGVLLAKDASRLARNMDDLTAILGAAEVDGWCVRTADGLVNTCTVQGRMLPHFLGIVAELERQFTRERTMAGLAAAREKGVRLGKRSRLPHEVRARILRERDAGATLQAIANSLTADSIPTGQGAPSWSPASVRAAYLSAAADGVPVA